MRQILPSSPASEDRFGLGAAAGAAIVCGAAYPATAVALRSFSPLAIAGWSCTLASFLVAGLATAGLVPRPQIDGMRLERLARLVVLAVLGGAGFIAAVNVAVALSGPTITGFAAVVEPRPLIPASIDPAAVIALLSIAVGSSSTASLLVLASVRRVPERRTSAALLLTPISSAVLGALILGEGLPPIGILGAALILLGIAGSSGIVGSRGAGMTRRPDGEA